MVKKGQKSTTSKSKKTEVQNEVSVKSEVVPELEP